MNLTARQRRRYIRPDRPPMDPQRPSYVYRIYDERGWLLYVGCSVNPLKRLQGHVGKAWFEYASRVDVQGPWPRQRAMEIEAAAIVDEEPYFNAQIDHMVSVQSNLREAQRRMVAAGIRYEDCGGDEWYRIRQTYAEQARDTHPFVDDDERLARYLNDQFDLNCGASPLPQSAAPAASPRGVPQAGAA